MVSLPLLGWTVPPGQRNEPLRHQHNKYYDYADESTSRHAISRPALPTAPLWRFGHQAAEGKGEQLAGCIPELQTGWQVRGAVRIVLDRNRQALHDVTQVPDAPRPVVADEQPGGFAADAFLMAVVHLGQDAYWLSSHAPSPVIISPCRNKTGNLRSCKNRFRNFEPQRTLHQTRVDTVRRLCYGTDDLRTPP